MTAFYQVCLNRQRTWSVSKNNQDFVRYLARAKIILFLLLLRESRSASLWGWVLLYLDKFKIVFFGNSLQPSINQFFIHSSFHPNNFLLRIEVWMNSDWIFNFIQIIHTRWQRKENYLLERAPLCSIILWICFIWTSTWSWKQAAFLEET